jgi:hypothetical protein
MQPLMFLISRAFKNYIKELVKKPLVLVLYILIAASVVMMVAFSFFAPHIRNARGSGEMFGAITTAALLVFMYFGIKQGIDRGSSFFRLADVNFVFTAPISPKKVLVYGFIKQLLTTFFVILFLTFQLPNLQMNFPIKDNGAAIIYVSVFVLFFSMQLIGMLVYSIASKSNKLRSGFEKALNGCILVLVAGLLFFILQTKDVLKAAVLMLNNQYISYIPFLGWFKVILDAAVKGIDTLFIIDFILVLLSLLAMAFAVYKLKTDYYEDVLAATEKKEELLKLKKEGKTNINFSNLKARKINYTYKSKGAAAIFHRQLLEYRKGGFFFINKSSIIIIAIGIASKYFFSHGQATPDQHLKYILLFTIYLLFFFSIQGKWVQELNKPYIYLIPSGSAVKVFYATLADIIKYSIDGILLFAAAGFMFKAHMSTVLLCALTYATYGAIYTYGDVVFQRFLGKVHSKNLALFLKMILILFIVIPGLILSVIISVVFGDKDIYQYYSYFVVLAYNIAACLIILFISKGVFEHLEMN